MAYLTIDEVRSSYGQLDESLNRQVITEGQVELWITNASNIIDGILSSGFEVPFQSPLPPLIKTLAYELFEYFWQKAIYTPTSTGDEVPWLYARYDRVINLLYKLASGDLKLIDANGNVIEPKRKTNLIKSNFEGQSSIFDIEREVYEDEVPENYGKANLENSD